MPESQLALSWDNFQQTMQIGIYHLLETEDLVDVTLCVEGKKLKAHKMILSVCSPFFKDLFESNPCQHPIIFLNEVKYSVMKDLLTYMYKGEVLLTQELLAAFVRLGESLQIRGLTNDEPGSTEQAPSSNIDQQLTNQRIFADSLPDVPLPKASSTPTIRRTMNTPTRPASRRPFNTNASTAENEHHMRMKRPKLAGNKTRFMLDNAKAMNKVAKIEKEDVLSGTEDEKDHIDDLSHLEDIQQHNYSSTTATLTTKPAVTRTTNRPNRRKSTASTASTASQAILNTITAATATAIDPMEMELAMIHQGQLEHAGADSEDGDHQDQMIIGGDGVLEDGDGILDGDMEEEEEEDETVEHKLIVQTEDGEVEIKGDDGTMEDEGGAGAEEGKEGDSDIAIVRTVRKQEMPRYIVDGFVFHVNIMKGNPPMTYLRCLEYKRLGCHARAVMPTNGSIQDIQLTQAHNHPPDFAAEEKIVFLRELKDFLLRHMNLTTKEVYDVLQPIYPTAASETPYDTIKNKMGRWKRSFFLDNEWDMRLGGMEAAAPETAPAKKRAHKLEMITPD